MSWFKELFGREPGTISEAYPAVDIPEKETVEVVFLEDHPRVVQTRYGTRAVINVMVGDEPKSLWLSRIGLANEIANLEKQVGTMAGKKAKITNLGKTGKMYRYQAVWVSKTPAAEKARKEAEK